MEREGEDTDVSPSFCKILTPTQLAYVWDKLRSMWYARKMKMTHLFTSSPTRNNKGEEDETFRSIAVALLA
jgi:hypothetical protein